ncbi:uncharacterized protein SCHCODRAFT_02555361 [Schizophyllum commune H4-8]|uniref:uncharacterized protein n=1 Tax=Schizophyllum commune (strain H4-8 / FGSC 9210) TaxID=578458 RepID=UPI002160217D|nr:uncharacterized protein SCHCODRAFT_02555361 [Schizophyllum commune H4-8]KAI5886415.1 hypothetical protein SCHCODRAFT_02555361 [Schizophyllum commune H4-8]
MFASDAQRALEEKQLYALFPEIELWAGGPITRLRESCLTVQDHLSRAGLLFTMSLPLKALMRSAGAYAVHVANVFTALRDVIVLISQGIASDEPDSLNNYTTLLKEKILYVHSRIEEALDARNAADATLRTLRKAVEEWTPFADDPILACLAFVVDYFSPVDKENRDLLEFAAEAQTLHERIGHITALLSQTMMLVQGIPGRFPQDKIMNIRLLPDQERVRVVNLVREADTRLELLAWWGRGMGETLTKNAGHIPLVRNLSSSRQSDTELDQHA